MLPDGPQYDSLVSFRLIHSFPCCRCAIMPPKVRHFFWLIKIFTTGLIWVAVYPAPFNPVTVSNPLLMLCLNLIYGLSFSLCHGLWSYIILSYLVTEKGQTGGTEQAQCLASFFPWYIFLWGRRLESETGGAWVIPASCGPECKAPSKTIPGQAVGTTDPFIFHGDPLKKFKKPVTMWLRWKPERPSQGQRRAACMTVS